VLRDVAVTRIQDGLGFAARQSDKIVLRLQEAQRELELGKTLPKFLLQTNQILVLPLHFNLAPLPAGFLRIDDSNIPWYANDDLSIVYLSIKREFLEAHKAQWRNGEFSPPVVGVIEKSNINFINNSDKQYNIFWSYYKAATVLTSNIENEWLANAPEWLIGEAGWRMAMDARDKDATALFDMMRKTGRAAVFGEIVASEESSGPLIMGANL
jgi:hypothetical protein